MSRKETRRLENRRVRAAERQVIKGAPTKVLRRSSWGSGADLVPNDEVTRFPKKKRKNRPKKERCPINGSHEFLKEERQVRRFVYFPWVKSHWKTETVLIRMCGWCGKEEERVGKRWREHVG